eukprot:CAMPEP_0176055840 /NCGR_PEP_ID=MMETSP0120_2-20121206/27804_1 /TAXON_ID=160619 /ORGANISM="Kryptoperidinium foliaceum, Strain CCMP 1326" /LENGTH=815 /DNA_ID=CAMNT_0017389341 /DNA_START=128 /DNA_END=2575 /DNA_ORIENTATION=-
MASIFRKLTSRRKKTKPTTASESVSIATSHTSELDAESPSRPLHLKNALKGVESSSRRRRPRSRSNDRKKAAEATPKENSVAPRRSSKTGASQKERGGSNSGNETHEGKSRSFRFSFRNHHQSSNHSLHASQSYDSEDETAATSTGTLPLKRGKKTQKQLAAQASHAKGSSSQKRPESAQNAPSLSKAEEIAKQNAINRETERIARAAAALDNRGNEYFERGYYDKAMDAYSRALKLKRRTFHSMLEEADDLLADDADEKNVDGNGQEMDPKLLVSMATSINNIGYLRQRAGEATPDETMAAYKKSLRIKRKILGNDSLSVGKTLNNIGSVYYLKKEFEGAFPAYEEALTIMKANLGDDHPDVATVISNMGDVNLALKKKDEALDRYRTALNIRWNAFGEKDPRTMRLLEKIARIEVGDKMPTPRGTKIQRQHYDWDESELFDLDLRPVSHELRVLKDQVKEDIEAVDLLEKKIAVGMVRDKVRIMRGMRELIEAQERQSASFSALNGSVNGVSGNGSFHGLHGSFSYDMSLREETPDETDDVLYSPGMMPAMTEGALSQSQFSPRSLNNAQNRVQEKLAKLRSQKGFDSSGHQLPLTDATQAHADLEEGQDPAAEAEVESSVGPSSFLRSAYYVAGQTQVRAPLSSMKPEEIKEEAENIESALKLKKGIDSLRSLSEVKDPNVKDLSKPPEGEEEASEEASIQLSKASQPETIEEISEDQVAPSALPKGKDEADTKDDQNEEVKSFFHDLMQRPVATKSSTKFMHSTWLGNATHNDESEEEENSLPDVEQKYMEKPAESVAAPKLCTWLGEIES